MRYDEDYFNERPSKSAKNTTNSGEYGSSLDIKVIQAKLVDAGYLPEELFKNSVYFETPDCEKIVYEREMRYKGGSKIISTYTQKQYEVHQEMLAQGLEVDKKLGTAVVVLYGGHVSGAIGAVSSFAASAGSAFGSMVTTTENVIVSPGGTAILGNSVTNVQITAEA